VTASRPGEETSGGERIGVAGVGIAAVLLACCAALPLIGGVIGGIAIGAVLGVGAGILALAALAAVIVITVRRRRACERPRQDHSVGSPSG
jgi:hypothetical protein